MAWSTPLTAVTHTALTAAQFNASVRDNLLVSEAATAYAAGNTIIATGTNTLTTRSIGKDIQIPADVISDVTYADCDTRGPSVGITTGSQAVVWWGARMQNATVSEKTYSSVAVSGATTVAASDTWAILSDGLALANDGGSTAVRYAMVHMFTGLTPGFNVFTVQYRVDTSTATVSNRECVVFAL
jgi:hypothetical protein